MSYVPDLSDNNLVLDTDSYKASHHLQYPPGTTSMFSYLESRGGVYDSSVFFGLQYLLKKYLTHRVAMWEVNEAAEFFAKHGEPFPYEGWKHVVFDLGGRLPIKIRAVPEGMVVPNRNVLMTVESTDPQTFWMVSWLETILVRLWYPITVATRSHRIRQCITRYLEETSDNPHEEKLFKLHDFGSRGSTSRESAMIGGMAHLLSFLGSDTVVAVDGANRYYNEGQMSGFSIPAAEHSTIVSWGREEEVEAYRNMLTQFARPGSLVAVVSDSYDLGNAVSKLWGDTLRQEVIDSGATVIIRPDSGDPVPVVMETLRRLERSFGSTINSKGFNVLNNVRVIQGDGINEQSLEAILFTVTKNGFSADNMAFGMGGGLLQQLDRDTLQFAFKCSSVVVDGQYREVRKDPVTDPGKASKGGRLDLVRDWGDSELMTVPLYWGFEASDRTVMRTVFKNGEMLVEDNLTAIRERLNGV